MFSKAIQQVEEYTKPVIFTKRHWNTQLSSGCGTCIILNSEGWLLTAAHIVSEIMRAEKDRASVEAFVKERDGIANNLQLHPNDMRKRLRALKDDPTWVTHHAVAWGVGPGPVIKKFRLNESADLAVGRLEPFDASWVKVYPVFKNPAEPMLVGTSLCRLGYPFHQIAATFDEKKQQFELAKGVLPVPRFPNEGIHTRIVNAIGNGGTTVAKFLETSSPGLKGQSGGPIFDIRGHIWAMQSQTQSLPLGFAPEVVQGKQKIVEHQFLHVGWGTHVEEIVKFCNQEGVKIALSS